MLLALQAIEDAQTLALAIVNTIHEPFLVLDENLRVLSASRSFYETFKVEPEHTIGCLLYALGDGQWNIPALRVLLETIIPEHAAMDGFEVDHDFPGVGRRVMLLNARKVLYETSPDTTILLALTDITERRGVELEKEHLLGRTEELLRQQQVLFQEMEHRVANSLQIIASILMLKARAVTSMESRDHLRDAHQRVMSVAAVQTHLSATGSIEQVAVATYLTKLCDSLAASMIGESSPVALEVIADGGQIASAQAVSVGLIVTELVINAIKYAFPEAKAGARVLVTFDSKDADWTLVISDNGVGKDANAKAGTVAGLGTVIVGALVKQLDARIRTASTAAGMTVTVTHTAAVGGLPQAA